MISQFDESTCIHWRIQVLNASLALFRVACHGAKNQFEIEFSLLPATISYRTP